MANGPAWGTRQVDCYSRERQVGEGTYGRVWMARDRTCGTVVALKRIRQHRKDQGLAPQAIREIRLLSKVKHHAVVRLLEIVTSTRAYESVPGSLFLVFEYIEHDLSGLLDHRYQFSLEEIKCFMHQLLDAVEFLHSRQICHRDIKCSNLLISNDHRLKVTDFGLARQLNKPADYKYTNKVVTLWYRPPELLLGECQYKYGIDLWSIGCIFVELFTGVPLFPGKTDLEQMDKIMEVCGTPTVQEWPRVAELPRRDLLRGMDANGALAAVSDVPVQRPYVLDRYLSKAQVNKDAAYLIRSMLAVDPARRMSASAALDHPFWTKHPATKPPNELAPLDVSEESLHEWETKKRRKDAEKARKEADKARREGRTLPSNSNLVSTAAQVEATAARTKAKSEISRKISHDSGGSGLGLRASRAAATSGGASNSRSTRHDSQGSSGSSLGHHNNNRSAVTSTIAAEVPAPAPVVSTRDTLASRFPRATAAVPVVQATVVTHVHITSGSTDVNVATAVAVADVKTSIAAAAAAAADDDDDIETSTTDFAKTVVPAAITDDISAVQAPTDAAIAVETSVADDAATLETTDTSAAAAAAADATAADTATTADTHASNARGTQSQQRARSRHSRIPARPGVRGRSGEGASNSRDTRKAALVSTSSSAGARGRAGSRVGRGRSKEKSRVDSRVYRNNEHRGRGGDRRAHGRDSERSSRRRDSLGRARDFSRSRSRSRHSTNNRHGRDWRDHGRGEHRGSRRDPSRHNNDSREPRGHRDHRGRGGNSRSRHSSTSRISETVKAVPEEPVVVKSSIDVTDMSAHVQALLGLVPGVSNTTKRKKKRKMVHAVSPPATPQAIAPVIDPPVIASVVATPAVLAAPVAVAAPEVAPAAATTADAVDTSAANVIDRALLTKRGRSRNEGRNAAGGGRPRVSSHGDVHSVRDSEGYGGRSRVSSNGGSERERGARPRVSSHGEADRSRDIAGRGGGGRPRVFSHGGTDRDRDLRNMDRERDHNRGIQRRTDVHSSSSRRRDRNDDSHRDDRSSRRRHRS